MDPADSAAKQHGADSRTECFKYPSRFGPFFSKQEPHHIPANQSEIGAHCHTDECDHTKRAREPSPETSMILIQAAQGCQRYIVERRSELARGQRKQVKCFLIESKSYRVKSPANEQVVNVLLGIGHAELRIDFRRKANHGAGLPCMSWQAWNPAAKATC